MSTPPTTKHATKTTLKATPKTSIPFGFYSHMQHLRIHSATLKFIGIRQVNPDLGTQCRAFVVTVKQFFAFHITITIMNLLFFISDKNYYSCVTSFLRITMIIIIIIITIILNTKRSFLIFVFFNFT